jgi:hypothetical protein
MGLSNEPVGDPLVPQHTPPLGAMHVDDEGLASTSSSRLPSGSTVFPNGLHPVLPRSALR